MTYKAAYKVRKIPHYPRACAEKRDSGSGSVHTAEQEWDPTVSAHFDCPTPNSQVKTKEFFI